MVKRAQHDKKKCVILNLVRNLEFANDHELVAFVLDLSGTIGPNGKMTGAAEPGLVLHRSGRL